MATTIYENPRVRVMVLFDSSIKVIIRRGSEFDTNPNKTLGENIHAVYEFLCERARVFPYSRGAHKEISRLSRYDAKSTRGRLGGLNAGSLL